MWFNRAPVALAAGDAPPPDPDPVDHEIEFVAASTLLGADGSLSSAAQESGLFVIGFISNGNDATPLGQPVGWNVLDNLEARNAASILIWRFNGPTSDPTLPTLSINGVRGHFLVFRHVNPADPFHASSGLIDGTGTTATVHPGLTLLNPKVCVAGYFQRLNNGPPTSPHVNQACRVASGYNRQFTGFTESEQLVAAEVASFPEHVEETAGTGGFHSFALALNAA